MAFRAGSSCASQICTRREPGRPSTEFGFYGQNPRPGERTRPQVGNVQAGRCRTLGRAERGHLRRSGPAWRCTCCFTFVVPSRTHRAMPCAPCAGPEGTRALGGGVGTWLYAPPPSLLSSSGDRGGGPGLQGAQLAGPDWLVSPSLQGWRASGYDPPSPFTPAYSGQMTGPPSCPSHSHPTPEREPLAWETWGVGKGESGGS